VDDDDVGRRRNSVGAVSSACDTADGVGLCGPKYCCCSTSFDCGKTLKVVPADAEGARDRIGLVHIRP